MSRYRPTKYCDNCRRTFDTRWEWQRHGCESFGPHRDLNRLAADARDHDVAASVIAQRTRALMARMEEDLFRGRTFPLIGTAPPAMLRWEIEDEKERVFRRATAPLGPPSIPVCYAQRTYNLHKPPYDEEEEQDGEEARR